MGRENHADESQHSDVAARTKADARGGEDRQIGARIGRLWQQFGNRRRQQLAALLQAVPVSDDQELRF